MCKGCAVDDYKMVQKTVDGPEFVRVCPMCGQITRQKRGKDYIVCLVGPSGTGKTSIAYALKERCGYNVIESYTTRPPRYEGERGHIFLFFESELEYEEYMSSVRDEMIAYSCYDGHDYFATKEQYRGRGISIYVIDVPGVKMLRKTVKDAGIVVIALRVEFDTMVHRLFTRKGVEQETDPIRQDAILDGIEGRLIHDYNAFAIIPCDYSMDANGELEDVVERVDSVIKDIAMPRNLTH